MVEEGWCFCLFMVNENKGGGVGGLGDHYGEVSVMMMLVR